MPCCDNALCLGCLEGHENRARDTGDATTCPMCRALYREQGESAPLTPAHALYRANEVLEVLVTAPKQAAKYRGSVAVFVRRAKDRAGQVLATKSIIRIRGQLVAMPNRYLRRRRQG